MLKKKQAVTKTEDAFVAEGIRLFRYATVDSTNKRAIEYAREGGADCPALFWADAQSAGSGRLGRSFFSPDGTGLYITLLTRLYESERGFALLTSLAAVCLRDAICEALGVKTDIKWVNDLYLNGKKVAGILAQSFVCEDKRFVALGVGVNISTQNFPRELEKTAGALLASCESVGEEIKRDIALRFCQKLLEALEAREHTEYMERYRKYSCVIGRELRFSQNGAQYCGYAEDITDRGALRVKLDSGETVELASGEISVFLD